MFALSVLCLAAAGPAGGCGGPDEPPPASQRKARPAQGGRKASDQPVEVKPTEAVGEYLTSVVKAKSMAETLSDKTRLLALGMEIQTHAMMKGGSFPASLDELTRKDLLRAPGPDGQPYLYVPGQRTGSPNDNILAYEAKAVHGGKVLALRINGTVDLLTPNELEAALARTRKKLR